MRRHAYALLAVLFAVNLIGTTCARAEAAEQEIAAALMGWADAYNSRDAARITALYAPDALFWGTRSSALAERPEQIATYFDESVRNPNLRVAIGDHRIRVYGDVGIAAGIYTVRDLKDGREVFTPGRFTFVFQKRGQQWVIVHHHSSRMPSP